MTAELIKQSKAVPQVFNGLARVAAAITLVGASIWLGQKAYISYQVHEAIDNIPSLFGQGEYDQAQTRLEQLISQSPNNAELHRLLGRTLGLIATFRQNTAARAKSIQVLERSVQLDPLSATNWFELANAYDTTGQNQKAEATYQKTLERDPYNSGYLFNVGFYFERNQQPAKAAEYYNASLAVRRDAFVERALARVQGTP
jgi:tetratricopeptide (TPR) repeat protein